MSESWRELLYPLGFLSSLAFGGRFFVQWLVSELERKSVVTRSFWQLSLIGNVLLLIHSFIQVQFHVCMIQACNAVISWRNLDLMEKKHAHMSLSKVLYILFGMLTAITLAFLLQGYILGYSFTDWFRLPIWGDDLPKQVGIVWHVLGTLGLILFSSRFWVQWWYAEQSQESYLGQPFWWLSLSGGILTLIYFIHIDDPVNIIGPAVGLIPYARNLMLLRQLPNSPSMSIR